MKKYLIPIISALSLLFNNAIAQQVAHTNSKSLLWRISGKHMSNPSYLFGTMHIICAADYIWTDSMEKCLERADEVCFEMDMDDPSVMMAVATAMISSNGKTIKDYLTDEQYKLLAQYVEDNLHMDMSVLNQMKPVALQMLFSEKVINCDTPVSYEERIMGIAKEEKKNIVGLEEAREQIALLEKMPADTAIQEIIRAVQSKSETDTEYEKMVMLYKNQDIQGLYRLIKRSKEAGLDMGDFLDNRNKKWIDRIVDKMDQRSVFFAVGAGHLWGDKGLISLLRKEGYVVEPVK
ncbi:MAG: TraB/GumN family protein [Bacteroidetes bacterium]|nr:TraB/GumN family protein [Bacteroidota bacterium]